MERRDFIGGQAALSLTIRNVGSVKGEQGEQTASHGDMSCRTLGRTDEKVSCIGLGGYHLGQSGLQEADAIKLFHAAVDRGINFSDNSWGYNNGERSASVCQAWKTGSREEILVFRAVSSAALNAGRGAEASSSAKSKICSSPGGTAAVTS